VKNLRGDAFASLPASTAECFQLLLEIERYPEWHPDVIRRAEVTRRDPSGRPVQASATVHLGVGPLHQDFHLDMKVAAVPDREVRLTRVPHGPSDREQFVLVWHIAATRLAIELRASLDVPRFLPVQGVGNSVAQGFVAAARDELERRAG
jgi:ribosome-associated toxin RatA of RatAB toxin-antitoxin module